MLEQSILIGKTLDGKRINNMLPHEIGTKEHPLRCSRLHMLVKCSMHEFLLDDTESEGGPAAQTGSVVHAGVAEFHRLHREKLSIRTEKGWEAIAKAMGEFPQADVDEARLFFQPYINDPRNINAIIPDWIDGTPAVEKQIDFTLPAHELDSTKKPIHIQGTFDHIRIVDNIPILPDLKTGKKTGWEMMHDHAIQIAAYVYGIKQLAKGTIFDSIKPGPIIRNYGYRARTVNAFNDSPDGVFFASPLRSFKHCEWILENVRMHIALYRMGYVNFGPGNWCTFCEHGGLVGCIYKYEESLEKLEMRK